MVEIKTQYPYIDFDGREREDFIKTYAEDENGNKYYIVQNETQREYAEAVDRYPSQYSYTATEKQVEDPEE